jgi:Peptidase M66
MRASTGLGLIAIISLFACTATGAAEQSTSPGGTDDGSGASTDPTDPDGSGGDPTNPEKAPSPIVANLAVTDVAMFQAVKVTVVKGGALVSSAKRNAPVVAKRPGLLRVYVKPGSGWTAREVTAEVRLVAGEKKFPILRETKSISRASTDEDPKSTFNIEVPADNLPPGVTFQVALTASDGDKINDGEASDGRFPADGSFEDLDAELSGKLKVVVVPVRYDTDGSGRTPDISKAQVERYKQTLMRWYPASEVEVTTHAPYPWTTTIAGNGTGFSNVLRAMHQLRQKDKVEDDVYYYGLLAPTTSMNSFCQGGCVAGLSTVADEDTPVLRASVGLGFVGQDAANTMAHEVGHAHGREHAPCGGASGVDPGYPYPQAQIGVWGYDIFEKTLISPTKGRDIMGYCPNEWVSDYTYKALFERIATVSTEKKILTVGGSASTRQYRIASVDAAGQLSWDAGDDVELDREPGGGTAVTTRFLSESGAEMATRSARFFRFDHLPGGFVFVPRESSVAWKSLRVDGYRGQLAR